MAAARRRPTRRFAGAVLAAAAMGAAPLAAQGDAAPGGPGEGVSPDPGWTLRTLDGATFTLGDLRGRPVFVNVWATWCPPCVAELASIDRLATAVGDGVAFLLVSPEDEAAVRAFLRRRPLGVEPVLEHTLAPAALGVEALPHTAILDADGAVVLRHRGAAVWDTPEVEALLRALEPSADPRPTFRLLPPAGAEGESWVLEVGVPRGWRIYAPGSADLGLPLAAAWTTREGPPVPAPLIGPEPDTVATAAGPVSVHRGLVRFSLAPPPAGVVALETSWALCRDELCVPGRTTVRPPP